MYFFHSMFTDAEELCFELKGLTVDARDDNYACVSLNGPLYLDCARGTNKSL